MNHVRALLTTTLLGLALALPAAAAKPASSKPAATSNGRVEYATFAMGCFWCGETQFEQQPGVKRVLSGYTGGTEERPTYEQVSAGATSHYESIQVAFDPKVVKYEDLLREFWESHDPTQGMRQGNDQGTQYRSGIYCYNDAQRNAAAQGIAVRFDVRAAAAVADAGPFDLVLVLEALHDMARPDDALRAIREALAPGGSVLVADEKVGDHFHAPADEIERLMYGWSIVHCLPVAMADQPSSATGTVLRADTVRALSTAAGLPRVEVVPVDAGFFRLYRLRAQ